MAPNRGISEAGEPRNAAFPADRPGISRNKPAGATCTPACLSLHAIISPFYIGQKLKVFYIARLNVVNHIAKTGAAIYPTA